MNALQQPSLYALIMCIAGMGIPIMAALNGNLGTKLNSPALATTILFMVGGVVSLVYLILTDGLAKLAIKEPIPSYFYLGGLFVLFYIFTMTWIVPRFGVGNAISMVLLGQIISMTVIDHYGLLGTLKHIISIQRVAGLALMMLGVYLTIRRS